MRGILSWDTAAVNARMPLTPFPDRYGRAASFANIGRSVGNASGGGAAGSNQPTASASSPAHGFALGSSSRALNQIPTVGRSESWRFTVT